jgi:hypothetical protein
MPNSAVKLSLVEPALDADRMTMDEHYPRVLVMWCTLAFCMSAWGIVIFAVRNFV